MSLQQLKPSIKREIGHSMYLAIGEVAYYALLILLLKLSANPTHALNCFLLEILQMILYITVDPMIVVEAAQKKAL